ncbi:aminotransferase class I/II-fold pyridoxal phosphate-dependent enzyme [Sinomonas sp. ASV322]|uniref:aminotransferase class I/II-fold pyridoxal phosphate-dependent enzyme n=1 Tax=Sinomonas sp. ASV322 TaxID=3041920 RepID=UPI0027DDD499|nr:aminotransferase class I/II-fold pyridoxal phosphate-dependent enzyme [Sinomonas sp. ASV322]MDQ4502528.1 aminotransferase class I/II-fold pyridoxal phosphate-dependent enzyme [Sinomonas sp. ASV322]
MLLIDLPAVEADPLWALREVYDADPRPGKLDLILGVYRDDDGVCPVMGAVRAAELRLARGTAANPGPASKEYRGLGGSEVFTRLLGDLVLGPDLAARAVGIQSVAGTGALRMLSELIAVTGPGRTVLVGTPAYVNHVPILTAAGLAVRTYPLVGGDGTLDVAATLDAIRHARPGDVLLLQGCCHNPTGLSLPADAWGDLAVALAAAGVVPFIDQAYYGLGDGLDADLAGMRRLLANVPEAVVAVSCSKAFGLYSERVGAAYVFARTPGEGAAARTLLEGIARSSYSQPPGHGADVVAEVLGSPVLRSAWRDELESMRLRLARLRAGLVASVDSPAWRAMGGQRGMFLRLPLDAAQMAVLRDRAAVYGIPSGRINLAGIPESRVAEVGAAIGSVHAEGAWAPSSGRVGAAS